MGIIDLKLDPGRGYTVAGSREELEKWMHPGIAESPMAEIIMARSNESFFDSSIPIEERRAMRDKYQEGYVKSLPRALSQEVMDQFVEEHIEVPGCPEEPDTLAKVTYFIPPVEPAHGKKYPVILWCCGGSLRHSEPKMMDIHKFCYDTKSIVVVPNFRTSMDAEYPAAVNDIHAGFIWICEHVKEIGGNPNNILIYGASSGGHLALSSAFRLKRYDYHGHHPRGVVATVPIVEDRPIYHSQQMIDTFWNELAVHAVNKLYLGDQLGSPFLGPEAFANRATVEECKGYPPTFIMTNEHDPQCDPCFAFAMKLREAGVYTEFHQYGGFPHAALGMEGTKVHNSMSQLSMIAIEEMQTNDFRRLWQTEQK